MSGQQVLVDVEVPALFLLAHFDVWHIEQIENQYWPECSDYEERRRQSPWWRVMTSQGVVTIGPRKRVISISWEDDSVSAEQITPDDVTKYDTTVHAWTMPKALEYLRSLQAALTTPDKPEPEQRAATWLRLISMELRFDAQESELLTECAALMEAQATLIEEQRIRLATLSQKDTTP